MEREKEQEDEKEGEEEEEDEEEGKYEGEQRAMMREEGGGNVFAISFHSITFNLIYLFFATCLDSFLSPLWLLRSNAPQA
jgi:hypothetical protein